MKKAKDYTKHFVDNLPIEIVNCLIKQAQLDAIEECVKLCAENADADFNIINDQFNISKDDVEVYVIKSSILNIAEQLKKEIK